MTVILQDKVDTDNCQVYNDGYSGIIKDFPIGSVVKNRLSMQEKQAQSLVQEDPTCCGATKPMCHNY